MIKFERKVLGNYFSAAAIDTDTLQILWIIDLLKIYDHEKQLNAGRFVNYIDTEQENKIILNIKYNHHSTYKLNELSFGNLDQLFSCVINWINEHCYGVWSLLIDGTPSLLKGFSEYIFSISFESVSDAILCKMVWM